LPKPGDDNFNKIVQTPAIPVQIAENFEKIFNQSETMMTKCSGRSTLKQSMPKKRHKNVVLGLNISCQMLCMEIRDNIQK
jgi:hypothetical protein